MYSYQKLLFYLQYEAERSKHCMSDQEDNFDLNVNIMRQNRAKLYKKLGTTHYSKKVTFKRKNAYESWRSHKI